jgi:hypothetical protein
MSVSVEELKDFEDKKVLIVRNLAKANDKGETAEELEGTLVAVAGDAVMFKQKGKATAGLIEIGDIEKVEHADTGNKKLARKTLKTVKFGQARNHLLERHGFTLTQVNELTEKQAFDLHEATDHEAEDLGHVHKDKADDEAEATEESADD